MVATELGIKLAAMGHQVHFISYALPYRLSGFTPNVFFHEVDVLHYPLFEYPPYSLSLAHKMAEVIEFEKLDILHVHYALPHATSAFLAREIMGGDAFPFITTLHGTDITLVGSDKSYLKVVKFSIEKSDGVTAVSSYLKQETNNTFDITRPIEVIPNFIPDRFLDSDTLALQKKCFQPKDEFILTHISNFRPLKRVADLVDVMERLVPKHNVRLLMVGDGPDRALMEQKCRDKGLCSHITFLGKQENIKEVLDCSDVFLLPSAEESFGLVVLEAAARGVPSVTTNTGGLPEVNIDGETGFLVDVGDTRAFSDAVERLILDRDLHKKLANNAVEHARSNFNSNRIVPQYLDFYKKILRLS